MTDREELAAAPLFAGLADADLDVLAASAHRTRLPAGVPVFREGDAARHCWLLLSGRVALELHTPGRGGVVIATLGAGQVLGWSWLYPPYRWHFDAVAVEPTDALVFDADVLRARCDADPRFGYELMQRFTNLAVQRLQATRLQLLDLYAADPTVAVPDDGGSGAGA